MWSQAELDKHADWITAHVFVFLKRVRIGPLFLDISRRMLAYEMSSNRNVMKQLNQRSARIPPGSGAGDIRNAGPRAPACHRIISHCRGFRPTRSPNNSATSSSLDGLRTLTPAKRIMTTRRAATGRSVTILFPIRHSSSTTMTMSAVLGAFFSLSPRGAPLFRRTAPSRDSKSPTPPRHHAAPD